VAFRVIAEQREELEKPWCVKVNRTSFECHVACGGNFLLDEIRFIGHQTVEGIRRF
jgi:hypothetical protein